MTDLPRRAAPDVPVFFAPEPAVARWHQARRNRTWRIVSLGISAAISFAIWWFFRDQLGEWLWWFIGLSFVLPVATLLLAVGQVVAAKADLARVGEGLALGIGRAGLYLAGVHVPWSELVAVRALPGRWGRTPALEVEARDGVRVDVPLDYLDRRPAEVDNAVWALSGGRVRVDFSRLDV